MEAQEGRTGQEWRTHFSRMRPSPTIPLGRRRPSQLEPREFGVPPPAKSNGISQHNKLHGTGAVEGQGALGWKVGSVEVLLDDHFLVEIDQSHGIREAPDDRINICFLAPVA